MEAVGPSAVVGLVKVLGSVGALRLQVKEHRQRLVRPPEDLTPASAPHPGRQETPDAKEASANTARPERIRQPGHPAPDAKDSGSLNLP